jgi:hypothetical protein
VKVRWFVNFFTQGVAGELPLPQGNRLIEIQVFIFRGQTRLWLHLCREYIVGDKVDETAVGLGPDNNGKIVPTMLLRDWLGELLECLKETEQK